MKDLKELLYYRLCLICCDKNDSVIVHRRRRDTLYYQKMPIYRCRRNYCLFRQLLP